MAKTRDKTGEVLRTTPGETAPAFEFYPPKTALGRKLMAIRAEIIASGEPLLDWDGVAQEIAERRGEHEADIH